MKGLSLCSLLVLLSLYGHSQLDTSRAAATLLHLDGFHWKQGDTKLSSKALEREISHSAAAIPYYKKGKLNSRLSCFFLAAAGVCSLGAATSSDGSYITNNGRKISFNLLTATSFIASALTLKYALKNKGRAVHLRNLMLLK
jgi:hypothetical protein